MGLPLLKAFGKKESVSGIFNGIGGEKGLLDLVNLAVEKECHTRKPRRSVMLYTDPPDQIIPCENRLFFRYGNDLREMEINTEGDLTEKGNHYSLSGADPSTDRKLLMWDEKLYVFPDNLQLGEDRWLPFAEEYGTSVSLPFVNPRTLFYTNGYDGEEPCDAALLIRVGSKLRFSTDDSKEYTVIMVEPRRSYTVNELGEEVFVDEGVRVTLDADVPFYKAVPTDIKIFYCNPENRPILHSLLAGYNHSIVFSGSSINFLNAQNSGYLMGLDDFFKVGQRVKISGCSVAENNRTAKIVSISANSIHLDCDFTSATEQNKRIITITPFIPDFSHFLLTEDRIFCVDNNLGTLFISALKAPFLFYDNSKAQEDSWSVKLNEKCTAMELWKDNIICFTESGGFRILGYNALNFGIRQLSINGVREGCGKSLVRVGDTLYYCSRKGIMKYSGGSDRLISQGINITLDIKRSLTDGVNVYMLSDDRIWVYDTSSEIWWSESAEGVTDIFEFASNRYLCTPQVIYIADADSTVAVDWSFKLRLLPDSNGGRVQPLSFALSSGEGSNGLITLFMRPYGEGEWKCCGITPVKGESLLKFPLPTCYTEGFYLRAEGVGSFHPHSWTAYYRRIK